ncbi:hypothetical protein L5515_018564 [Caenorhabditis briggsae]|uniref:Uncharacterized protein n=1 Tax=Caenorhabditis briggsae TaxID=6238 RepID=A0AAE9FMH4_CAEBR|nr:hypothetical protein L5515_018564 [Caenorhabditis briggsae]
MSSLNKEMNDLSSAMEEVRLSSQPIDMEESSEAVTMVEDSNMSVDEKREQEYKLRVLEALEKGVQHQLKKKKILGRSPCKNITGLALFTIRNNGGHS